MRAQDQRGEQEPDDEDRHGHDERPLLSHELFIGRRRRELE